MFNGTPTQNFSVITVPSKNNNSRFISQIYSIAFPLNLHYPGNFVKFFKSQNNSSQFAIPLPALYHKVQCYTCGDNVEVNFQGIRSQIITFNHCKLYHRHLERQGVNTWISQYGSKIKQFLFLSSD